MSCSTASHGNAPNQERQLDISSISQPVAPGDGPHQNTPPEITPTCQPALETMPVSTATPGEAARHPYSTASQGNAPNQERQLDISSTSQPASPGDGPHQNTPPEITPTCQPALETMLVSTATPGEAARHHATLAGTSPPPQAVTSESEHAITEGGPDQESQSNISQPSEIAEEGTPSSRAASGDVRDGGTQAPPTADAILEKTKKRWRDARERRDCKELIRILDDSDRDHSLDILKGEIGEKGRTALHVAAMQGCMRLIDKLKQISASESQTFWDQYLDAKDGHSRFTASEMSSYSSRNALITDALRPRNRAEFDHHSIQNQRLDAVVAEVDWPGDLEEAFNEDVDFNFGDANEFIVFRFHHACKLHNQDGVGYIHNVWARVHSKRLKESLCTMEDWQGRVPLEHYMMDSTEHLSELPPVLLEYTPAEVAIRISQRHIIMNYIQVDGDVGKLSLQHVYRFLESKEFSSKRKSCFPRQFLKTPVAWTNLLDLLMVLGCTREAFYEIKDIANRQGWTISPTNDKDRSHPCLNTIPSISLAASIGDPTILQLLLRNKCDPFICDDHSRSPLHYAVDTTFQSSFASIQYCFRGTFIEDYCKLKGIWLQKALQKDIHYVGKQACFNMLARAGVDIWQQDKDGEIPDPKLPLLKCHDDWTLCSNIECGGASTINVDRLQEHQNWWNEKLVKDTMESKNNFNQASNALSVVGTLVAATSYVGPMQPPSSYSSSGYVHVAEKLIRVFMVSNTLAFYLAIAAVMLAVVPSLPIPQEGVVEELRRARHTVALSLCLLLVSILCVITSFASASMSVIGPDEHPFHKSNLLYSPTIIGLFFCSIAIFGFFIRMMRLVFYRNAFIRKIHKFSFTDTPRLVCCKLLVLFLLLVFAPTLAPFLVLFFIISFFFF